MSSAKLTLIGIENYLHHTGLSLFDEFRLPSLIDRETLINSLLLDAGEFEVMYSNPDFLKSAINLWFMKNFRTFNKWINALDISYNPLENYDRMEEWTDENVATGSQKSTQNGEITGSSNTKGTQTSNGTSDVENKVSAYDSSSYQPHDIANGTTTDDLSREDEENTSSTSNSTTDVTSENRANNKRVGRAHGNIGVTTSQQMLQSELDIAEWNIYQHIIDMFILDFCIAVY